MIYIVENQKIKTIDSGYETCDIKIFSNYYDGDGYPVVIGSFIKNNGEESACMIRDVDLTWLQNHPYDAIWEEYNWPDSFQFGNSPIIIYEQMCAEAGHEFVIRQDQA